MSDVAWQKVWSLFEETIALPVDRQQAFLDAACGEDTLLAKAVERMLNADRKASSLLDQPVIARPEPAQGATTVEIASSDEHELPTEAIGPYRLLRKVGEGGMSTVYLAVREDDAFSHQVVVKLIRRGLESEAMIHRFQVERQILANLTHPSIARLYDGGATAQGLPYLVMEYVEGEAIDAYCSQHDLAIDDRLQLFSKVCDAVRYAHQNLVVHRDLKPANIMVSLEGEPKLLDFGIAKLLSPEHAADASEPTVTWHGALTPSYASPEQIRGKRVTTASDVYSLGVVLYRLLTGTLPFDFQGLSPTEIERLVTETEPERPSAAVDHRTGLAAPERAPTKIDAQRRAIEGDLDAIVLKALRSTPGERYASVEQLSADLERYRHGLPVSARQGTWRYRASKFVRRNRLPVSATALVGALLAMLAVTIVWQSLAVARERDEARLEGQKKQQVLNLVLEVFQLSNPYVKPGAELTVRQALTHSAPLLMSRLRDQPEVRAELLHTTGSIRAVLGDFEQAAAELQEALTLRQALLGIDHPDAIETASALVVTQADLGELEAAEALAQETVATARLVARTTDDEAVLIPALTSLITVLCYRGDYTAAAQPAEEAYALVQRVADSEPYEILVLEILGLIHSNQGEYRESIARYRQAVALRNERQGKQHPEQINALNNLGLSLRRFGELDQAEEAFRRVLALHQANFGDEPTNVTNRARINLGGVYLARNDFSGAEALYRRALADAGGPGADNYLVLPLEIGIADTRLRQGYLAEAEDSFRRIIKEATARLGGDHWRVAQANSLLGASISTQNRFEEAEPLLIDSYQLLLTGAKARYRDDALERLRNHFERAGRRQEIEPYERAPSERAR